MEKVDRKVIITTSVAIGALVLSYYLYRRKINRAEEYIVAIKRLLKEPSPPSVVKISTRQYDMSSKGVPFHIHLLEKPIPKPPRDPKQRSPFKPPFEPGLHLTDYGEYRVLYNKFCVESKHILLVTKDFKNQEEPLTERDFEVTLKLMKDIKGFAFYNSGPESGYSQDHKHIQLMPFISFPHLPIKPIVNSHMGESEVFRIPEYPFQHLFHKLTNPDGISVKVAYDRLMSELQVRGSYNMILTKSWMLIVPRNKNFSLNRFDINALAYAGLIFIKKQEDFEFMKKVGIIEILKDGAFPL